MVVVCLSEPLMRIMSSANLRLERFVSGSCSAGLTPWSFLYHFPVTGFRMYWKSELKMSVLSGSPCLVLRSRWKCLLLSSVCTDALLVVELRESQAFHTLLCCTVSNAFLKSMAGDGPTLLCMTLIVVSRQFGGGCSWGLMALWYNRSRCFRVLW